MRYDALLNILAKVTAFVSEIVAVSWNVMGLLPVMQKCGLRMRRECRERFPRHR